MLTKVLFILLAAMLSFNVFADDETKPSPSSEPVSGKGQVVGKSLTTDEIMTVVRAGLSGIRKCYEAALKGDKKLKGKIVVEFNVIASGAVDKLELKEKIGHAPMDACVVGEVSKWTFPKPRGDAVTVQYPFIFSPT